MALPLWVDSRIALRYCRRQDREEPSLPAPVIMNETLEKIKKAVKDFLNWLGDEFSGLSFVFTS